MWGRPPRPSGFACVGGSPRPGQAERSSAAGTSPNTPVRHPRHSARRPPAPHPCASKCTDKLFRAPRASSSLPNTSPAARFARTAHTALRNPSPPTKRCRANASHRSSPAQIRPGSAADPSLRCEGSTSPRAPPPARPQSKKCAHAPRAAVQSEKAQAARDKV